jgi:hypothetical protein
VTIDPSTQLNLRSPGDTTVAAGMVFPAHHSTEATPISGNFNGFPGGAPSSPAAILPVSYTGGDGNDLTLTVQ